jgi:zinc protease
MASGYRGTVVGSLGRLFESGTFAGLGEAQLLERFLTRGDEAAFEAILQRHGPMVLGVCRRVLEDPHDIADAFQATFLILVKKARSIRDREALGTWLYGVARRVAVRARVNARRLRTRERTGIDAEGLDVDANTGRSRSDRLEMQELRSLIDAELERLPARYRAPLILCDLEGLTQEQAAAQLGCPVGTVKSRLSRGREQLRSRLVRRGIAPSSGLLAATLAAESAHAVPVELMSLTLAAAARLAAGQAIAAGASSAGAIALMKGVLRSMSLAKIPLVAAALAAAALATTGVRALVAPAPARPAAVAAVPRSIAPTPANPAVAAPAEEPNPPERGVTRFRLANGLKVILRPIRGSETTALVVVYSIGGDHDPEGRSGLGHAIEHLYVTAAAGAEKARTAGQLMKRYPAGANGQTGDRYTVFSTVFSKGELDRELTDAAARMGDLRVTAADLDRERPRLVQEVENMFDGFPALAALNRARELVRPMPGSGRHGGPPEQIRALTIEDVQARLNRYYKPRNAILALAGDFDPVAARKMIESHFAALSAGEEIPPSRDPGAPKFLMPTPPPRSSAAAPAKAAPAEEPESAPTACLAYLAPRPDSDLYAPFLVLITRLWAIGQQFDGPGVTGSPVFFTPLDDGSIVGISATIRPGETSDKAFERIEKFVAKAVEGKLGADEPAEVGQMLGMLMGLGDIPDEALGQNPYGVAFSLARRDQLGLDPARFEKALRAVTDQDLKRVAAEVFAPGRHAGTVAGYSGPGR